MDIPERFETEGLVEYAERLSEAYSEAFNIETRKAKGQIFTHKQVASFMAGLSDIRKKKLSLLDPGAGTGVLAAAFCERLLSGKPVSLAIDAYENDSNVVPYLRNVLEACKSALESKGSSVEFSIFTRDFILSNEAYLGTPGLFSSSSKKFYDFVISNPPYYKLSGSSPYAKLMAELICGQPNIYALFMALSASMLAQEGEMVFITPRSFCSGLYYKTFRKWFLNNVRIRQIHIFESRKAVFDKDEILQENIILKAKKTAKDSKVTITTSRDKDLSGLKKIKVDISDVVSPRNGESFIKIPASKLDVEILHIVDGWPCNLKDFGFEISTGPVVDFRARKHLLPELKNGSVPLLWMHNMRGMDVVWPKGERKASAIVNSEETRPLLLPVKNYVLLKRFTSKEQKRRLDASVFRHSEFPFEYIGIENHVNYIHKPKGEMTINEAYGIAALLNTAIIDNYFRSLNGHTQVNATEIRTVPLPCISIIKKIGALIPKSGSISNISMDRLIAGDLGITAEILDTLEKGRNGKNRRGSSHPNGTGPAQGSTE
jgi:adenine-specific DNA-methyltransferase